MKCLSMIVMLLLIASCATTLESPYFESGHMVIRDVPLRPGTAAWSPDSSRFAIIKNDELLIFNTATGHFRVLDGIVPLYIEWAPGSNLLAVHKTEISNELLKVDVSKETFQIVPIKEEPEAVKWLYPPDRFIVFSKKIISQSIGTFVTYTFTGVDKQNVQTFYNRDSYFPTRDENIDFTSGWTFAGVRPLHDTVLAPEYHDPPRLPPFTLFKTVDPVIDETYDLFTLSDTIFSAPSTWSPDGSRLAIVDSSGALSIVNVSKPDERLYSEDVVRGRYPSWNSSGSQLYIGGWIVESDGSILEQLIPDARESLGIWSPDGTGLIIVYESDLFYLNGFVPEFHEEDRPMDEELMNAGDKIRLLKNLLNEDLMTVKEFKVRRTRLLANIGMDDK